MYYHKTRDIVKVKELLGHVNVNNTLIYLHLCARAREYAEYLDRFETNSGRIFEMGATRFRHLWDKASKAAGFRITPQVLRVWFATEMGELGVPDRYVDVFQGRAP